MKKSPFRNSRLLPVLLFFLILAYGAKGYSSSNAVIQSLSDKDPFYPYLTGKAPNIIKELGEERDSVNLRRVLFHSRDVNGIPTQIFAVIAKPLKDGKYPGLLVLHGGGGSAEIDKVRRWASKGYVAVSLDIPGVSNPEKVPNSSGNWKSYPYGKNRFTANPDIKNSVCFDGVLAALQALYLLNNQPEVIKNNLGVTGVSWGGYTTTMICGLANKHIKAGFSTYGSGFYDAGSTFLTDLDNMPRTERETWLKYLDAGRRAKYISFPFFIAAATNDNWFYPPAVMATLNAIGEKANHFFAPNSNHSAPILGGNISGGVNRAGWMQMEETYFDYYLKNTGLELPVIKIEIQKNAVSKNVGKVKFQVKSKMPVVEAAIWFTSADALWTKKKWLTVKAHALKDGWYEADLPKEVLGTKTYCFASISDQRPVTVSSKLIEIN